MVTPFFGGRRTKDSGVVKRVSGMGGHYGKKEKRK